MGPMWTVQTKLDRSGQNKTNVDWIGSMWTEWTEVA